MDTLPSYKSQSPYRAETPVWIVREAQNLLSSKHKDVLLKQLEEGTAVLSVQVLELNNLGVSLSPEQERKLVFELEGLLDIRRELLREAGL